jgi:hypothetical protein
VSKVTGGEKLRKALGEIGRRLSGPSTVKVGFLANATYPDGKPVAMIAAIQEFGAPRAGIPPRPFFRNMIRAKKGEWPKGIATQLKATNFDVKKTLELTGQAISGQLRQSIIDTNSPALAPSTIARKGHAKPLVDSGHMLGSVDYEVKA